MMEIYHIFQIKNLHFWDNGCIHKKPPIPGVWRYHVCIGIVLFWCLFTAWKKFDFFLGQHECGFLRKAISYSNCVSFLPDPSNQGVSMC